MINAAAVLALLGLALAVGLIVYYGFDAVVMAFATAGFGVLWMSLFHIVPTIILTRAWQVLLPGARPASLGFMVWVNWIRESLNTLVPLARVAGDVVAVRLMIKRGVRPAPAVTSLVVDTTLSIVMQYFYTVIGVALLLQRTSDVEIAARIGVALIVSAPVVAALLLVQRFGLFSLFARAVHGLVGRYWPRLLSSTARLDRALKHIYRRRDRIIRSCAWQLAGWIAAAGEIWLGLYFLGNPVSFWDALLLETMVQVVASAAFIVPGALGVQEGGFVVTGALLGIGPDVALALALMRRARDLIVFVPAMIAWHVVEGRRFFVRSDRAEQSGQYE